LPEQETTAPDGLLSRTLTGRVANGAEPSLPQCRERSGYEPSAPIERSRAGGSHFDSAPTLAKRHE
jgi:hypothetical protein